MRPLSRLVALSLVAAVWLVVLTAQLPAQQAVDPLRAATAAMGAGNLRSLRYVGFGATYTAGAAVTRVPLPRYEAGIEATPHGFLQAAAANHAVARAVPLGVEIRFVAGGRRYAGVLNERHLVDRVQAWIHDPLHGEMMVETFYRDYDRFGRVMFPTHITQDLREAAPRTRRACRLRLARAVFDCPHSVRAASRVRPLGFVGRSAPRQGDSTMKRTLVLGLIVLCGVMTAAVLTAQQPAAPAGQGRGGGPAFPPVGAIEKVAGNLYMVPGQGGNTAVFVTANGVVLVDTKLANNGQAILDQVRSVTDKPITHIINTHTHGDHTGSNQFFPATVEIVVQENTAANMRKMPVFQEAANKQGLADRTFKDKLTLLVGRRRHRPLLLRRRAHQRRRVRGVPQRARDALGRRVRQQGRSPSSTATTAAAASPIGETLGKAAKGIPNVTTVIPGHSAVTTWQDFVDFGEFNRLFLEHARASLKAGKTPEQAMMDFKLPEKFKGYSLTGGRGGPGGQLQRDLRGTEAVAAGESRSRARARGTRGAALRRRRGPDRRRRPGLVKIAASGLNFIDVQFRAGKYPPPATPFTLGMEGAGTVSAVGPGRDRAGRGRPRRLHDGGRHVCASTPWCRRRVWCRCPLTSTSRPQRP